MRFTFEPVRRDDLELLSSWQASPRVKRWWPDAHDLASLEHRFEPFLIGDDPMQAFVCSADDQPMGYVQAYRFSDEPAWRAAIGAAIGEVVDAVGIDYYIGESGLAGRGLGAMMIAAFTRHVWSAYPDIETIVVAVQQANTASWRSLERAGFVRLWEGLLESDDPSDQGPAYVYSLSRTE